MNSKALLFATAALLAMSAVSCGKDNSEESSVSISLSEEKTTEDSTEEATEEETETAEVSSTTTSADASSTTTTAVSTETSVTDTTTTAAATSAEVSQPEETTPPEQNVQPDNSNNNSSENQVVQDNPDNSQQPDNNQQPDNSGGGNENPTEAPQPEEVKFNIDQLLTDASEIVSKLGTPVYEGGGAACLSNGHDGKIYQYDGLEIQCYVDGDAEYIFQINITGGNYQTDKGIKVGSTRADVEAAYGTGTESGNMIIYSSGNNEMDIQYNGDTVASIFFYTPV